VLYCAQKGWLDPCNSLPEFFELSISN